MRPGWAYEFVLEIGTVANSDGYNKATCLLRRIIQKNYSRVSVSLCHRGGRMENINAWYLNTHMVYL
jgi:hypothetical protein